MMKGTVYRWHLRWKNIILFSVYHLISVCYFFLLLTGKLKSWHLTFLFHFAANLMIGQGVLAGAHRHFSHRSFKAKLPLRLFLIFLNTLAFASPILDWAREHRQHHKYSDTDADPHNASRGFFYSHLGSLLIERPPLVKEKAKAIDMSDLERDPLVMFQKRYYYPLVFSCTAVCLILPPIYLWNETLVMALISNVTRYTILLNCFFLVNSAAHTYGGKPYDKSIRSVESSFVSFATMGEGWHNYHHTFPWDYRAAEYGLHKDPTTRFIDFFAWIGWAYDLKDTSSEMIKSRAVRTGDGTHPHALFGKIGSKNNVIS